MAQVTVRVGGYAHPVACQDGQEKHLTHMAAEVDQRISALKAMGIQFGETRMLLLAALQLADEAMDLKAENESLKAGGVIATEAPAPDPAVADGLVRLAEKLEAIAARLEEA
ncbi:MAG: cell division protein ZapA [Alphaproteobacteria bacterium]